MKIFSVFLIVICSTQFVFADCNNRDPDDSYNCSQPVPTISKPKLQPAPGVTQVSDSDWFYKLCVSDECNNLDRGELEEAVYSYMQNICPQQSIRDSFYVSSYKVVQNIPEHTIQYLISISDTEDPLYLGKVKLEKVAYNPNAVVNPVSYNYLGDYNCR